MIVLDTMVLSEMAKANTDDSVRAWLNRVPPISLYMTAVSRYEIQRGIYRMPVGAKRTRIELAVNKVILGFAGRSLPLDDVAADVLADYSVACMKAGINTAVEDMMMASIAIAHGFTLCTRNLKHFLPGAVSCVDPWTGITQ